MLKHQIVLFCKSYRNDVLRVRNLVNSIQLFNKDCIPLFISTPQCDQEIFREYINPDLYEWIDDLDICKSNPIFSQSLADNIRGHTSQQIIKSEFWRLGLCENYLCLDSDAIFIKDFYKHDFLDTDGYPFTVMHSAEEFIMEMKLNGKNNVIQDFQRESSVLKKNFDRLGSDYDFGPSPFIWSSTVWRHLNDDFLEKKGLSIWDAIKLHPMEMRWYGEYLLASKVIPIKPIPTLFKVYHYYWQQKNDLARGVDKTHLTGAYLGLINQSNWDRDLDLTFTRKSFFSRTWKMIKDSF